MTYKIWHSWLSIPVVAGLRWIEPQETLSATATANWTPAPTHLPEYAAHELFKKDLYPVSLCGWQGPEHQGAYCGSKSYCAWVTDISVVGCCASGGSCDAVFTSCIDERDDPPTGPSVPGVLTCTELCYRNSYPAGYYQYGCGSTSTGENVVTSWTGANPQFSLAQAITGGVLKDDTGNTIQAIPDPPTTSKATTSKTQDPPTTSTKSSDSSTTTTGTPTSPENSGPGLIIPAIDTPGSSSASPTGSSSASGSTSPTVIPAGPKKGLSTGSMVAIGVAVGVVAIVAIVLFAFWCYRRRQKSKAQHGFLNNPANGGSQPVAQYAEPMPIMGTSMKPAELHQDFAAMAKEEQHQSVAMPQNPQYHARESGYTNSVTPSYDPYRQASPQPSMSTATFTSDSPYPTTTGPVTDMSLYGHLYGNMAELPTNRASRIQELDSSQVRWS